MFRIVLCIFIALIIIPSISIAEIKTYTHTVKQPFGGSQSPDDARVAATAKAKREALEKAGTYLESMTIIKNYAVQKDEILALAAGILKAEILYQKNYASEDAFGIIVVAKVDVDTSILEKRVKKLLQDRTHLKKYQEIKQREEELLTKIKQLEKKNRRLYASLSKVEKQEKEEPNRQTQTKEQNQRPNALSLEGQKQQKKELKKQFKKVSLALSAVDINEKVTALWANNEYSDTEKALEYLNQAIQLDPNFSDPYNNRGALYFSLGKYQRAIQDYNRAILLKPDSSFAYSNRGVAYKLLGKYYQAIKDYDQAIRLNPNNALAYSNRGNCYNYLRKYQQAIDDCDQAIRLDPNIAWVYRSRGFSYQELGKHHQAIDDYNRAIRLNPNDAIAYNNRGFNYRKLGNDKQAIADYNQAIRLNPNNDIYSKNLRIAKQKPCFIATAAYGSSIEHHIKVFREFRGRFLLPIVTEQFLE